MKKRKAEPTELRRPLAAAKTMNQKRKVERAAFRRFLEGCGRESLIALIEEHRDHMYEMQDLVDFLVRTLEPYRRPEALAAGPTFQYRPDWQEENE